MDGSWVQIPEYISATRIRPSPVGLSLNVRVLQACHITGIQLHFSPTISDGMRCQLWWWNVAALTNYHITLAFGLFLVQFGLQLNLMERQCISDNYISFYSARSVLHLGLCLGSSPVQVLLILNCCCKIMPGGVIHLYFKEKNGVLPKKGAVPIRGAVPIFVFAGKNHRTAIALTPPSNQRVLQYTIWCSEALLLHVRPRLDAFEG